MGWGFFKKNKNKNPTTNKKQGLYHLLQKVHSIKKTLECIRISQNMSHFYYIAQVVKRHWIVLYSPLLNINTFIFTKVNISIVEL